MDGDREGKSMYAGHWWAIGLGFLSVVEEGGTRVTWGEEKRQDLGSLHCV